MLPSTASAVRVMTVPSAVSSAAPTLNAEKAACAWRRARRAAAIRLAIDAASALRIAVIASVQAGALTANGPYYAWPAWAQKLPAATRFVVIRVTPISRSRPPSAAPAAPRITPRSASPIPCPTTKRRT